MSPALAADVPTLAELLKAAGFQTAAFVSSVVLTAPVGPGTGVRRVLRRVRGRGDDARFLNTIQKRGDVPTGGGGGLAGEAPARGRCSPGSTSTTRTIPTSRPAVCRRATRTAPTTARWPGRTSWWAARRGPHPAGPGGETLLVVTSDHGEGLGEHGEAVHGYFVYESTLRVPLILRGPGIPAGHAPPGHRARRRPVADAARRFWACARPADRSSGRTLAGGAARRAGAARGADLRGIADAAPALRLERPAQPARRALQVHPGAAPELYDLRQRSAGDERPRRGRSRASAAALRAALAATAGRASARSRAPPPPRPACRRTCWRSWARSATSGGGSDATPAEAGRGPEGQARGLQGGEHADARRARPRCARTSPRARAARLGRSCDRGIDSFEVHYYLARALLGVKR